MDKCWTKYFQEYKKDAIKKMTKEDDLLKETVEHWINGDIEAADQSYLTAEQLTR